MVSVNIKEVMVNTGGISCRCLLLSQSAWVLTDSSEH